MALIKMPMVTWFIIYHAVELPFCVMTYTSRCYDVCVVPSFYKTVRISPCHPELENGKAVLRCVQSMVRTLTSQCTTKASDDPPHPSPIIGHTIEKESGASLNIVERGIDNSPYRTFRKRFWRDDVTLLT
jgi:hypothetical protein